MVETLNHTSTFTYTSTSTSTYEHSSQLHNDYRTRTIPRDYNYDHSTLEEDEDRDEQPPIPPPKDYIESPRRGLGSTSIPASSPDQSYGLPEGMDVREALAQCEDPALGWSLQFWATIADPVVSLVQLFSPCLIFE